MTDRKIGTIEATALVLTIIINHIILNLPKNLIANTSSATILNVIWITLIALFFVFFICKILKKFPNLDILDISNFLGGKWLKFAIGFLFLTYFIFTTSIMLRSFSEGLKIIFFPNTSAIAIIVLFLVAIVITNKLGFASMVRANLFLMPPVLFSLLFVFIANIDNFTIERMFPLLGNGFLPTFLSGTSNLFAFGAIGYLYLIPPVVTDTKSYKKVAFASILISGFFLLVSVATLLFMYPFVTNTEEVFPLYIASRFIEFGRFFQRLDAVFLLLWILSVVSYLSIAFYFCTHIFKKITNLEHRKPIIMLFALLIFGISLIPENLVQIRFLENTVYQYIVLGLVFVLCFSILIFAAVKYEIVQKKKGEVSIDKAPT